MTSHSFPFLLPPVPLKVGVAGHFRLNLNVPQMLRRNAVSQGKAIKAFEQITSGATISANWNHRAGGRSTAAGLASR